MMSFLRIGAVLAALCAISLLNRDGHEQVVIVVLEGARRDVLTDATVGARLPILTSFAAYGSGGDLHASHDARSADAIVSSLFAASHEGAGAGTPDSSPWSRMAQMSRVSVVVGVAGTDERIDAAGGVVLAGPDAAHGFLGSNLGIVLNRDALVHGTTPWPYSVAEDEILTATQALDVGEASSWITVRAHGEARESATGRTRVYALDEDTLYVSPVYTRVWESGAEGGSTYVADDPSPVVTSSRASAYLPRHVSDLATERLAIAMELAPSRPWELFVYVDRRVSIAEALEHGAGVETKSSAGTAIVDAAYSEIEGSLARLLALAGPRSVVIVVGVHNDVKADDTVGWYSIESKSDSTTWSRSTVDELAATFDYLLGLPPTGDATPIPTIVASHPTQRRLVALLGKRPPTAVVPLDASRLRTLSQAPDDERSLEATASRPIEPSSLQANDVEKARQSSGKSDGASF